MKQTILILTALAAVLLLMTGFVAAANLDLSHAAEAQEREIAMLNRELEKREEALNRSAEEASAAAEALRKTMAERDALSQQLNDAVLASQEANDAVEQQILQNQKQLQEMASLAAEYDDLSEACNALEARVFSLSEAAAQSAMTHEAQSLADAKRIAELEQALEEALAPATTASPTSAPGSLSFPKSTFVPLITVTPIP